MKITHLALITTLTTALIFTNALAATQTAGAKFTGVNYSGVYECVGSNAKIGNYNLLVTFALNKSDSHGNLGRYDLTVETENATTYTGHAIANGRDMALTIEFADGNASTYSTGIARLNPLKNKRFSYINRYYESNQATASTEPNKTKSGRNTGNDGTESCVMQKANKP